MYVVIFAAVSTFALTTWLYVTRISHFRLAVRRIVGEGSEVEHLDETATSLITVVNRDYRKGSRSEITCDDGVSRQLSSKLPFGYGMAMYHRQIT